MGSSGCGKSSLLKCIMGRLRVSPGTIKVFNKGEHISEQLIGFMPQVIESLFWKFSQTLLFFFILGVSALL
jgi:ABC-type Mn2+/Zn2+ transport system ATPase subunit